MALTRSFTLGDTTYPAAYSRIDNVTVTPLIGAILVHTYADVVARQSGAMPVNTHAYLAFPGQLAGDTYKLAYAHLANHPDFAGAVVTPAGDDTRPPAMPPTEEVLPPPPEPTDVPEEEPISEEFTYPSSQG